MKKELLVFSLLLSTTTFSSLSFGEWISLGDSTNGAELYVDFEQMRKSDGRVYWTYLRDNLEPDENGTLSLTVDMEGNCADLGTKILSTTIYEQPMASGSEEKTVNQDNAETIYSKSDSVMGYMLQVVCGVYFN